MTTSSSPLRRVAAPLRQQVIELLRDAIAAFEYQPGERLIEKALCARYGVSRTVVREALRQLEAEGLVTMVPNHGPVVAVLSAADARELYEVRAVLEALAGRLCALRITPEQRSRLVEATGAIASAFAAGDLAASLAAKDAYYDVLFDGVHNEVIRSTLRTIQARVRMLRGLSLQAKGWQRERGRQI